MGNRNNQNASYVRLLLAAKKMRGWNGDAEISRGCAQAEPPLDLSASRIGNWKLRGVGKDSLLDLCRIIGCRPLWIRDGTGIMEDVGRGNGDPDIDESLEALTSVHGRLRTKAATLLIKEVKQLVHDATQSKVPKSSA